MFSKTLWTVAASSLTSTYENYKELEELWDWCLDEHKDREAKTPIHGVQSQMQTSWIFFWIGTCYFLLRQSDNAAPEFNEDIVSYYRKIYYEASDCITNAITDRFDQQDFKTYIKLEKLLIKAVKGNDFHAEYDDILSIDRKDFDDNRSQVQLETLSEYCKELDIISVRTIVKALKNFKVRSHLTEIIKPSKLILMMPTTNSTPERSFSLLKLVKTYLRLTMK